MSRNDRPSFVRADLYDALGEAMTLGMTIGNCHVLAVDNGEERVSAGIDREYEGRRAGFFAPARRILFSFLLTWVLLPYYYCVGLRAFVRCWARKADRRRLRPGGAGGAALTWAVIRRKKRPSAQNHDQE